MTPPPTGPNSPYWEEKPHWDALHQAIDLAIDDAIDRPNRAPTATEREKFCYFVIEEFDVPVTYSWYLAGANTKFSGEPNREIDRAQTTKTGQRKDAGVDETVQKYRSYLASEDLMKGYSLRKVWWTDKYEFLCDFYKNCAPEDYIDLYIASTRIREQLETLDTNVDQETENQSLSAWTGGNDPSILSQNEEEEFRLLVSDLHLELSHTDELSEITQAVTKGTDVLEQVFAQLTTLDSVDRDQKVVLDDLAAYFYYDVWRYPALYISATNAFGPNKHHLTEEHATHFNNFHEKLRSSVSKMRQRCEEAGLYPGLGHHSEQIEEPKVAYINSLLKDSIEDA